MKIKLALSTFILIFTSTLSQAECRVASPSWTKDFDRVHKLAEFYIFYTTNDKSINKAPPQDFNKNKIPDYIENIALQAQASRAVFQEAGFRHPLKSPRYQKNTKAISIFVKDIKGNGVAYEVASQYPSVQTKIKMPCSLVMHISNDLKDFPGNYWTTVTHELFHLYQYSYSQFKNSWYLESLANWSERALRVDLNKQTLKLAPLPQNHQDLNQQIFQKSYNSLWRRYFLIDQTDSFIIPNHLKMKSYINGDKIFKDPVWYGTKFVLNFLENLELQSASVSKQQGWNIHNWKEVDQRQPEWNCTIFKTLQTQLVNRPNLPKEAQYLATIPTQNYQQYCQ